MSVTLSMRLPQMMIFLAAAGYTDSWIDIRGKVRAKKGITPPRNNEDNDSEDDR